MTDAQRRLATIQTLRVNIAWWEARGLHRPAAGAARILARIEAAKR